MAAPRALEALPAAAYTCDAAGLITYFNGQAAKLWDREPRLHDPVDRYCGSFKLFTSEGTPLDHACCWMARAPQEGAAFIGHEFTIKRPNDERWRS